MNNKFKYIEIKSYKGDEIALRIDITGKSERDIEKAEEAMGMNLNHNEFYIEIIESDKPLPITKLTIKINQR